MKLRYKILGGIVAILAVLGGLRFLHRGEGIVIPHGSTATVITTGSTISTVINTGTKTVRKDVPNYGHGTVTTVNHAGDVTIEANTHGLSDDIGFSTDFTRIGLGLEVGYYYRINLLIGSHIWNLQEQRLDPDVWVGIGYRLPWSKVDNVSVFTGVNNFQRVFTGIFIRFGSN